MAKLKEILELVPYSVTVRSFKGDELVTLYECYKSKAEMLLSPILLEKEVHTVDAVSNRIYIKLKEEN